MGTAPIEAFLSDTLVAGWDGVGGREYMSPDNMWIVPNGDVIRLAMAIGNMVESYILDNVDPKIYESMKAATQLYTKETEKDSIIETHNGWRNERIEEMNRLIGILENNEKGGK
jgi:hypothetical protein